MRLIFLTLLAIAMSSIWLDQAAAQFFKYNTPGDIHRFFKLYTHVALADPYFALSLVGIGLTYLFSKLRSWRTFFAFFFVSLISSGLTTTILKALIGRRRPFDEIQYDAFLFSPMTIDWNYHSFPSGHSQVAFTVATVLSFRFPRHRLVFYFVAATLAFSRVITTNHFVSDTIFGAFIGLTVTTLIFQRFYSQNPTFAR